MALAATHSPDELNLVLVDFKGGATFLGCEGLPHTSAVITNLEDEAVLVERMFDAISGEMNRRQELLRAAGNFANITEYNAARTSTRPDLDPLPSLVIVVDEFSELLGQHPNFADLFVAVGRLGRSLGVHLLLASQRLEEGKLRGLDSHLSYRIGLRTFSAAESRQVLGVSDAYELPADPGAGYIKTASTELTRFKASYVSGPLMRPAEPTSPGAAPQVRLFAGWDEVDEPAVAAALPDPTTTLLAEVVSAAQKTAAARGQSAHTVWLPPLPPRVGLPEVCEDSGELKASIGLIDDPYHQRQHPLTIDLGVSGGHVALAGGPQTGKSMAVRTIIASLAATHTTDQLGFYVIDAGGGDSDVLESLPHVAGVAGRGDEEKVKRVVDEVLGIVDKRRAFPARTVLVVDGWHSLIAADSKLEDLKDALATIAAEGPAAGVHLVVTTQRWNAVRPNVRDLIGTRLELKLTEPMDSLLDRKLQEKLPAAPGRGITAAGKSMLIAATAKEDIAHIAAQAADQTPVPKLKVLPARIAIDELAQSVPAKHRGRILLGIGGRDVEPVTFDRQHLLAVGASGAGKSEALRTIVVSLAATHSPDELNFVLVDFKGGATFLGCDHLPHTAAVITNLEDESALVERMYDAISGEMNRRQEILRDAGNFANVTDYTTARLSGRDDLPALPALVIVVDEFSELLMQHPDFAELFVAVGRLGRSLHVHLLLASQRLEEGRLRGLDSHLSYRIGLKTFSAAESRQVLGVSDAYHLPAEPGAGYLKTDADALARFQAFYVSGGLPREAAVHDAPGAERLPISEFTGWDEETAEPIKVETYIDDSTTLLAEVVDATREEAARRGLKAHRVWLAPLPPAIELPAVAVDFSPPGDGQIHAPVGIIDRPFYQRQDQLLVNLSSGHMAICGGPQSGKSMALLTIVASLAAAYSPDFLRFYVIDLGGGQLSGLNRLPHVAAVAGRHEEEKVRRVIDEVMGLVEHPESRHTYLVIDGWHHMGVAGADFEDLSEPITRLAVDGPSARVHVIISTPRWTTMRPAIRDLITERLELKLGEPMDSLFDRKKQQKLPNLPGRGITPEGESMLMAATSRQDLAHIESLWTHVAPVPELKMLPATLSVADLVTTDASSELERNPDVDIRIPWARGGRDLETQTWDTRHNFFIVGTSGVGKSTVVATLLQGIGKLDRADARIVLIDQRRAHLGTVDESMLAAYSATSAATEKVLRDTATTLAARLPGPDITPAQLTERSWWTGPDIYVVIDDLDLVSDMALAPIVELLPHARDIGLHIVAARKAGGIGRALFGQFLAQLRDTQPAIFVMDTPRDEGAIFGIKPAPQPIGRGQLAIGSDMVGLCQAALPESEG